jgi:hypothetical protein
MTTPFEQARELLTGMSLGEKFGLILWEFLAEEHLDTWPNVITDAVVNLAPHHNDPQPFIIELIVALTRAAADLPKE